MTAIQTYFSKRNVIKISHELNRATYELSATAIDILCAIITEITNEDEYFDEFIFHVSDLENKLGHKLNRKSLRNAITELKNNEIIFRGRQSTTWMETSEYDNKTGMIALKLNDTLYYDLVNPKLYSLFDFQAIVKMGGAYSKRIYMLLSQFTMKQKLSITINELNKILNTPASIMNSYSNFKNRVLKPAIDAINEYSNLTIKIYDFKFGRSYYSVDFIILKTEEVRETKREREARERFKVISDFESGISDNNEEYLIAVKGMRKDTQRQIRAKSNKRFNVNVDGEYPRQNQINKRFNVNLYNDNLSDDENHVRAKRENTSTEKSSSKTESGSLVQTAPVPYANNIDPLASKFQNEYEAFLKSRNG